MVMSRPNADVFEGESEQCIKGSAGNTVHMNGFYGNLTTLKQSELGNELEIGNVC